jgi:hypothetical protein
VRYLCSPEDAEPHPNQHFTALIRGEYRDEFDDVPESLLGKTTCISCAIAGYNGKVEIQVSDPSQIRVLDD